MTRKGLYITVVLLLGGCSPIPRGVLSLEKMENLCYEMHLAEGVIQVENLYSANDQMNECYTLLLEKYGITQADFDSSLVWYINNPQFFNKVYPRVVQRLEDTLKYLQEHVNDTLNVEPLHLQRETKKPILQKMVQLDSVKQLKKIL